MTSQPRQDWLARMTERGEEASGALSKAVASLARSLRLDSWANAVSGIGTWRDKTTHTHPYVGALLTPLQLEALYHNDDIATRIVSAVPEEAFREAWKYVHESLDQEDETDEVRKDRRTIEREMKRLDAWRKLKEAAIWGRLYGLGAVLVVANGDPVETWAEPLDWNSIRSLDALTVLDKRDLQAKSYYNDLDRDKFQEVAEYWLQPVGVYLGQPYSGTLPVTAYGPIVVHESRLIRFGGELTSKRERLRNKGNDYSILQKTYRALQLTHNNWQSASTLLADAGQGVFKIRGLIDMIAQNPEVMNDRMQLVDMMRSTLRAVILDAGDKAADTPAEDFTRIPTPFNGIPDMLAQTWNRLCLAAKMPMLVLMGSKPMGLNSDSEEDMDLWYNSIEAEQRNDIKPKADQLVQAVATAAGIADPESWCTEPGRLRRVGPAEQADISLKNAQRDKLMVADTGAWTPEEVALSRAEDPTGETTRIDTKTRKAMMAAAPGVLKAQQDGRKREAQQQGKEKPAAKPKPKA